MQNIQLDQDEHITLSSYRHWINLVPPIVSGIILLIGAAAVAYVSGRYNGQLNNISIPTVVVVLIILLLVIFAAGLIALAFWVYRRNQLILTNKHLIKVEQDGLFARRVSQLSLGRVQDVNGSRRGLIPTILNFGNVEVQTAGEQEEFIFVQMPDPDGLANQLIKAHDEFADGGDGTGTVAKTASPAPAPVPATSPLQPPAVAPQSEVATPPPPVATEPSVREELPKTTELPSFELPPEEQEPAPPSVSEPSVEEPPPAAAPLTENQTVQIPPPEPPAS